MISRRQPCEPQGRSLRRPRVPLSTAPLANQSILGLTALALARLMVMAPDQGSGAYPLQPDSHKAARRTAKTPPIKSGIPHYTRR
jgi:hypothetical protein